MVDDGHCVRIDGLALPSDGITLRMMRSREPMLFAAGQWAMGDVGTLDAFAVLRIECRVAARAFDAALHPANASHVDVRDREEDVESLIDAYREYGLSGGEQESRELVRRIEAQAVEQAKQITGRPR